MALSLSIPLPVETGLCLHLQASRRFRPPRVTILTEIIDDRILSRDTGLLRHGTDAPTRADYRDRATRQARSRIWSALRPSTRRGELDDIRRAFPGRDLGCVVLENALRRRGKPKASIHLELEGRQPGDLAMVSRRVHPPGVLKAWRSTPTSGENETQRGPRRVRECRSQAALTDDGGRTARD